MSMTSATIAASGRLKGTSALGALLLVAAVIAPPFLWDGYALFKLSLMLSYAVILLGLNLLTGWTGQISVGHGAFVAAGAYVAAIAITSGGMPFWMAIPLAALACFVIGFLLGIPALRFEGHHLALLTFVLAICLPQILKTSFVADITGGVSGIILAKPVPPGWFAWSDDIYLYCIAAATFLISFVLARNLGRGRIGRALLALRENPTAAATMGIDVSFFKTMTFGISAAFAGAGGALGAILVQYVSPDTYSLFLSISLLVGVVVGGLGLTIGALYGALFIQYVPEIADSVSSAIPWTVYGALLIAIVFLAPDGIAGAVARAREKIASWISMRTSAL